MAFIYKNYAKTSSDKTMYSWIAAIIGDRPQLNAGVYQTIIPNVSHYLN